MMKAVQVAGTASVAEQAPMDQKRMGVGLQAAKAVLRFIGLLSGSRQLSNRARGNQVSPADSNHVSGQSTIKFAKTGRKVDPAGSDLSYFLIPLAMWGVLVVVSFSLTYWQFEETGPPTRSLSVASRVEALASMARFYANDLVLLGTAGHVPLGNRTVDEEREYLRQNLHNTTERMYVLYENLLLGGGQYDLKGSLYTSTAHEPILFDHLCLRKHDEHHAPPCLPFGHDYYYRTRFGLDNLIKHYREECLLLALEPVSALNVNNSHYKFIWEAGKFDLRGGLRDNTHLYMEDVRVPPARDRIIQICSLVIIMIGKVYTLRYVFLPWFKRTKEESHRIAELFAQLPAEIDMHAVIAEHLLMTSDQTNDF